MLREISFVLAIAVTLLAVIWGVAHFGGGDEFHDFGPTHGLGHKTIACYKLTEDVQLDGHVCIYMCEDGEKTRLDHLKACLPKIEL